MAYHNHHLSQDFPLYHFADQHHQPPLSRENSQSKPDPAQNHHLQRPAPNWLNNAGLHDTNFLNLQTTPPVSDSNRFFSTRAAPILMDDDVSATMSPESPADLKSDKGTAVAAEALVTVNGRRKAEILAHPLYEQLLSSHVACLRIATPVDQLPRIDAQLAESPTVLAKYSAYNGHPPLIAGDVKELDHFMTRYVLLLCSFKEQLQQHVRVHAMEAVYACWEIEQSLQTLTGVSPGEGTGATMSDDEDDDLDGGSHLLFDGSAEGPESMGSFGPLIPTETERCLMERVRQELKLELKNGYKEKIVDIREEILRKRRAGKLPGDTTSVLKAWWQSHSKWPYPTEEDKARLVQETGLQLKQINNWFINQRKRNWNTTPSSSTTSVVKSKRKSR